MTDTLWTESLPDMSLIIVLHSVQLICTPMFRKMTASIPILEVSSCSGISVD